MARRKSLSATDVTAVKNDFLWRAANEMYQATPTISQHLAASLVAAVPDDGMSAFAKRMHCTKCGGLMTNSKVRIRKAKKRTRRGNTACRNTVQRTCAACGEVNVEAGAERGTRPRLAEESDLLELRKRVARKKRKERERLGGNDEKARKEQRQVHQEVAPTIRKRKSKKKSKRDAKRKDAAKDGHAGSSGKNLAASFLFEPL